MRLSSTPAPRLGPDRRETPRYPGLTPLSVLTIKGPVQVDMVDVSLTGCRIRNLSRVVLPRSGTFRVPKHEFEIRAECVWTRGTLSGWRFSYSASQLGRVRAMIRSQDVSVIKPPERRPAPLAIGRGGQTRRL